MMSDHHEQGQSHVHIARRIKDTLGHTDQLVLADRRAAELSKRYVLSTWVEHEPTEHANPSPYPLSIPPDRHPDS